MASMRARREPLPLGFRNFIDWLRAAGHPALAERAEKRRCGLCTLCCTVMAVHELAKPAHTPCPHLRDAENPGCSIYSERPLLCRSWMCAWRFGFGAGAARPDRLGDAVLLEFAWDESHGRRLGVPQHDIRAFIGIVRALRPFDPAPVLDAIEDMRRVGVIYFGATDPTSQHGDPIRFLREPEGVRLMVEALAVNAEAPWNRMEIPDPPGGDEEATP